MEVNVVEEEVAIAVEEGRGKGWREEREEGGGRRGKREEREERKERMD